MIFKSKHTIFLYSVIVPAIVIVSGCATRGRLSAVEHTGFTSVASSAVGSGVGAVVGNQLGLTGEGAAVGAGAGLLGGFVLGAQLDSMAYRIEKADEALKLAEREIEHVRSSLKQSLFKGDQEMLEAEYPKLEMELGESLNLNSDQITSLKLLGMLLKNVSHPVTVNLMLNVGRRVDVDSKKPEDLIHQVEQIFEEAGLPKSLIAEHIEYRQDKPTKLLVTVERKFLVKPSG